MADGKPGAPKGHPRWGGRVKGTLNAATVANAEAVSGAIIELGLTPEKMSGLSPLQMMLVIAEMRFSTGDMVGALAAAALAAPFVHPRLTAGTLQVRHEYADKDDETLLLEAEAIALKLAAATKRLAN